MAAACVGPALVVFEMEYSAALQCLGKLLPSIDCEPVLSAIQNTREILKQQPALASTIPPAAVYVAAPSTQATWLRVYLELRVSIPAESADIIVVCMQ